MARWADLNMMTPKQVGRRIAAYGMQHPEAWLRVVEVPQVPGSLRRSRPVRGTAESALKTKRYLAVLLLIQPEVVVGSSVVYVADGRWKVGDGAELVGPEMFEGRGVVEAASREPGDRKAGYREPAGGAGVGDVR